MLTQRQRRRKEQEADVLFSQIVRLRDRQCQRCGVSWRLENAHVWPRRYHAVRFDEVNGTALCSDCHVYFTHYPFEWYEFMAERLGRKEWALLRERALFGDAKIDYSELIPRLEARLEELS